MRQPPTLLLLLLTAATSTTADEANLCRITANYGCTELGYNCADSFDIIAAPVPTFDPSWLGWCPGSARTKSADKQVCCLKDKLNGGYCPDFDELKGYGFAIRGLAYTQKIAAADGPAVVKCNQRDGPHFCIKSMRVGGVFTCIDPDLY